MSNLTASLINGSVGQDFNSNPPEKESNPPTQESSPSSGKSNSSHKKSSSIEKSNSPQESEPPAEKSHTSQKGSHLPNKESGNHVDDFTELYTYPNNSLDPFLVGRVFSLQASNGNTKQGEGGEGEQQSTTGSSHKTPSSPTSDTISGELDNSRKGDESDDKPPHTPNPPNPIPGFILRKGPFKDFSIGNWLWQLRLLLTRNFLLDLIANPPEDVMDWSKDELLKFAENEAERLLGDVDPAESGKASRNYLAKGWPFLFGEAHGKTLDDVVYESYDQSPNLLKKLDDLTDSVVSCGINTVEDCYFSASRSKYHAATPKPAKWHRDAIDDHKIYFSGNQDANDRLFWIAKKTLITKKVETLEVS
ncbi:hypothetical protein P9112_001582 [Eukaryota sp. TZLM1-RC]